MPAKKKSNNPALCSFCGKPNTQVSRLIAGPGVYICNECVVICCGILSQEMPDWPKYLRPESDPLRKTYAMLVAMRGAKEITEKVYHARMAEAVERELGPSSSSDSAGMSTK